MYFTIPIPWTITFSKDRLASFRKSPNQPYSEGFALYVGQRNQKHLTYHKSFHLLQRFAQTHERAISTNTTVIITTLFFTSSPQLPASDNTVFKISE